jgi:hypothetical protein
MAAMYARNPYVVGDPVGDSPAFVGRADVLRAVLRVLRHERQNAIVLYGQRHIGKTSILQQLAARLPEEGAFCPVDFALQNKADWPLGRVLPGLARTAWLPPSPVLPSHSSRPYVLRFALPTYRPLRRTTHPAAAPTTTNSTIAQPQGVRRSDAESRRSTVQQAGLKPTGAQGVSFSHTLLGMSTALAKLLFVTKASRSPSPSRSPKAMPRL